MARPASRSSVAAACLCALGLTGCVDGAASPLPFSEARSGIVDGTLEPGEPAVVMIYHDYGAGCTATVVSPRVVITARHCVRASEGTGSFFPASGWHVLEGPSIRRVSAEYRVSDVRSTEGSSIDNADFAILILDRDFRSEPKRWAFTRWPGFSAGSRITAIGYGQTRFNDPDSAGTKYRREGVVQGLGPWPMMQVGDREFMSLGENTCQGDSGGPLLYNDVQVGVTSRGEPGCTGRGWVTRVSSFAEIVLQALRDTGACVPTGFEVCNGLDDDCWGGADDGLGDACPCAGGAGPSDEVCDQIDNDCNGVVDDIDGCGCRDGAPPSEEVCDGIDNDCNGQTDEVCQHLGESCVDPAECSTGHCIDGVCTAPCRAGVDTCIEGGYCDGPPCGDGLCRPGGGDRGVGQGCGSNGECGTGFCAPTRSGSSVCARPCAPDQLACFATEVCATLGDGCGACLEPDEWDPPRWFGEPCEEDGECMSGWCLTDGDPESCGEGCARRFCSGPCGPDVLCPPGGHCRDGACVRGPESEPGDTCMTDADCPGGVCVALFGIARCVHPCPGDGVCEAPFSCREGVCWPDLLYPGDPCNEGEDEFCTGGICDVVGDSRLCLEPCSAARECPSGLACLPYPDRLVGVCVPYSHAGGDTHIGGDDGGDDGCRCVAAGARGPAGPKLLFVAAVAAGLLLLRRRRR